MTDRDKDVVRALIREEFQVMIDLSVAQHLAKLKDEIKRELAQESHRKFPKMETK